MISANCSKRSSYRSTKLNSVEKTVISEWVVTWWLLLIIVWSRICFTPTLRVVVDRLLNVIHGLTNFESDNDSDIDKTFGVAAHLLSLLKRVEYIHKWDSRGHVQQICSKNSESFYTWTDRIGKEICWSYPGNIEMLNRSGISLLKSINGWMSSPERTRRVMTQISHKGDQIVIEIFSVEKGRRLPESVRFGSTSL